MVYGGTGEKCGSSDKCVGEKTVRIVPLCAIVQGWGLGVKPKSVIRPTFIFFPDFSGLFMPY